MITKYNQEIDEKSIEKSINKLTNQIYKLLPDREEGIDWVRPLQTIQEELSGMGRLFEKEEIFFSLLCKLEGLFLLDEEESFFIFRKTIFDCLRLINSLKGILCQD